MKAVIRNKLRRLLSVKQDQAKIKNASGSIDSLMILISIGYFSVLILILVYQDLLVYGSSKPCPSITEPFSKCSRVLGPN